MLCCCPHNGAIIFAPSRAEQLGLIFCSVIAAVCRDKDAALTMTSHAEQKRAKRAALSVDEAAFDNDIEFENPLGADGTGGGVICAPALYISIESRVVRT